MIQVYRAEMKWCILPSELAFKAYVKSKGEAGDQESLYTWAPIEDDEPVSVAGARLCQGAILAMVKRMAQEYREARDSHPVGTHVRTAFAAKCAVLEDVERAIETGKVE